MDNTLTKNAALTAFFGNCFKLLISMAALYIIYRILKYLICKILDKNTKMDEKVRVTSKDLFMNILKVIFIVMAVFTILDIFGVNTASLVATAGIGGVAIGFGAQSLVKDVISGIFIIIEGQYLVGDEVVIDGVNGNVIEFTMRTTKIRDIETGAVHIIPNGQITKVENRSMIEQNANIFVDIPLKYDPESIIAILKERFENFEDDRIVKGPDVLGVSAFKEGYFSIFISTNVKNGEIYAVQRDLRLEIYNVLKENGIDMYQPAIAVERK